MRKYIALLLVSTIFLSSISMNSKAISYLLTSDDPLEIPVTNSYIGREKANTMIKNLNFSDVSSSHWAKEAITRLGALDIIKGYNYSGQHLYYPESNVSNQEALAFVIRAIGLEGQAQEEAINIDATQDTPQEILDLWSRGYLVVANQIGLITANELDDSLAVEQEQLDPNINFIRENAATREQVAQWIIKAMLYIDETSIKPINGQQEIYEFSDWMNISPDKINAVEQALENNIMSGFTDATFRPQGSITRAQMAQVLKNMDEVYFITQGIIRKNGIVVDIGQITEYEGSKTNTKSVVKILVTDGTIEEVIYNSQVDSIGQVIEKDVVVFGDDKVSGLMSLKDDDYVEYLVDTQTSEMIYINNTGKVKEETITGVLQPLTDISNRNIVIETKNGNKYKYKVATPLLHDSDIYIDGQFIPLTQAPIENWVELIVVGGVVTKISYKGLQILHNEITGIVTDISPNLGYITVVDSEGNYITKHYYKNSVYVEKQQYYDDENEIGYYDEVFPDFRYDPMDTTIDKVDIGDTVTIMLDDEDNNYIEKISAKSNYRMYYGKVEYINSKGIEGNKAHVLLEDGSRVILDVNSKTPTFKGDKHVGISQLQPGDWAKILVNQAVIQPGQEVINVIELVIDDASYLITNIYRGQISYFNKTQNQLYLQNAQTLSKLGWVNYQKQKTIMLSENVEYYHDNERVSKDYIEHFLKYSGEVYIAVESNFGQEAVRKVSVRSGIDYAMEFENVTYSNGSGSFKVESTNNYINADNGTIIVRNGRLVDEQNIMVPDYAQVILNGNKAAVINITQSPITDNIKVYRGRIESIKEGVSLTVQSHSELNGMTWSYSPVQSSYTFDYTTKIYDENGLISLDEFIDYTDESMIDEVFTIFVKGNKAEIMVKQPYVKEGVRGEIYKIEDDKIYLRDSFYYDIYSDSWKDFSAKNVGSIASIPINSVIIKNGVIASKNDLEPGDKIRVVTDENLLDQSINNSSNEVKGYIIYVEG